MEKQLVVRIPRATWRLFRAMLEDTRSGGERLSMQEWIDQAVGQEIAAHQFARGARENGRQRELLSLISRTVGPESLEPAKEVPAFMRRTPPRVSAAQVIARLSNERLNSLRAALRERGLSITDWLRQKIAQAVSQRAAQASGLLSPAVRKAVGSALPRNEKGREAMAYALLDWPDEVVLEAAEDPAYGLRQALRTGDVAGVSEILSVAAVQVEAAKRLAALKAKHGASHVFLPNRDAPWAKRTPKPVSKPVKVAVDQGINLPKLRKLEAQGKITLHQVHDLEQRFPGVQPQGRAARYGQSKYGGPDMYADEKMTEIVKIVGPENVTDAEHVYAAYLNRCDYFVTDNPDHFVSGGRRERLEEILGLTIRRTAEFLSEMGEEERRGPG